MKCSPWLLVAGSLMLGCHGQPAATTAADVLPLRSVRLYEVGVAYFERAGVVSGDRSMLPVPASHVDDALKTLVVLSAGRRADVSGIEFESLVSRGLARSLAALPLDPEKPVAYRDVLQSLTGVEVELVTADDEVVGTLVEVFATERKSGPERLTLTLLERDGSVRRAEALTVKSIRPTDPILAARLQSAVTALSGRAAQMPRALSLSARSRAAIRLGYLAETPVWRSTYRVVLGRAADTATLQGWALIHNDTDEAWSNVEIELVNGRPDSFLFPLSAPRYARRPLAEPAEALSTVPQLADKTADQIWGDNLDDGASGLSLSGYGSGGGGAGYGVGYGSGRLGVQQASTVGPSNEISIGNLAQIAQASGVETGALFSYRLSKTVALRAHGSALVPFTERVVQARRITWFAPGNTHGQTASRFVNTTTQTLPSGPVALYEPGGFAGETGMPRLKPGERAFLRYGVDLDLELETRVEKPVERVERLEFEDDRLIEHFVRHHASHHVLENRSADPRLAYVVLEIVSNARVAGADELDFDQDQARPLAVFRVLPRQKSERKLVIDQALQRSHPIEKLDAMELTRLSNAPMLPEEQRKLFGSAKQLLELVAKHERGRLGAESEIGRIELDLKRVREHLQALGDKSGTAAGNNPIVARLIGLENRLSAARERSADLAAQKEQDLARARRELEKL